MRKVMVSPIAGKWYQDSASALKYDLGLLIKDMAVIRKTTICAAVVPHAGY